MRFNFPRAQMLKSTGTLIEIRTNKKLIHVSKLEGGPELTSHEIAQSMPLRLFKVQNNHTSTFVTKACSSLPKD